MSVLGFSSIEEFGNAFGPQMCRSRGTIDGRTMAVWTLVKNKSFTGTSGAKFEFGKLRRQREGGKEQENRQRQLINIAKRWISV